MAERLLHPEDYPLPHPPLTAFVRANGLHERDIAAAFPLIVEDGRLTVTEFIFEPLPGGKRRMVLAPGGESAAKHSVTVPLVSPPEDHGL